MNITTRTTINVIGISGFILWLLQFLWSIQTHQNGEIHDPVPPVPITYENKSAALTDGYMGFVKKDPWPFGQTRYYLYVSPTKFDNTSRIEWHDEAKLMKIRIDGKSLMVMALTDVQIKD